MKKKNYNSRVVRKKNSERKNTLQVKWSVPYAFLNEPFYKSHYFIYCDYLFLSLWEKN